jgi:hypothetical protein
VEFVTIGRKFMRTGVKFQEREGTPKPLHRSDRKKRVFKEYLEDENLWMNGTLENVDHIREKQDCCQGELYYNIMH